MTKSEEIDYLAEIPIELQLHILGYLPLGAIYHVAAVSSHWYGLVHDPLLLRELLLREYGQQYLNELFGQRPGLNDVRESQGKLNWLAIWRAARSYDCINSGFSEEYEHYIDTGKWQSELIEHNKVICGSTAMVNLGYRKPLIGLDRINAKIVRSLVLYFSTTSFAGSDNSDDEQERIQTRWKFAPENSVIIQQLPHLRHIALEGNRILDDDLARLVDCINGNQVNYLSVRYRHLIKQDVVSILARLLPSKILRICFTDTVFDNNALYVALAQQILALDRIIIASDSRVLIYYCHVKYTQSIYVAFRKRSDVRVLRTMSAKAERINADGLKEFDVITQSTKLICEGGKLTDLSVYVACLKERDHAVLLQALHAKYGRKLTELRMFNAHNVNLHNESAFNWLLDVLNSNARLEILSIKNTIFTPSQVTELLSIIGKDESHIIKLRLTVDYQNVGCFESFLRSNAIAERRLHLYLDFYDDQSKDHSIMLARILRALSVNTFVVAFGSECLYCGNLQKVYSDLFASNMTMCQLLEKESTHSFSALRNDYRIQDYLLRNQFIADRKMTGSLTEIYKDILSEDENMPEWVIGDEEQSKDELVRQDSVVEVKPPTVWERLRDLAECQLACKNRLDSSHPSFFSLNRRRHPDSGLQPGKKAIRLDGGS